MTVRLPKATAASCAARGRRAKPRSENRTIDGNTRIGLVDRGGVCWLRFVGQYRHSSNCQTNPGEKVSDEDFKEQLAALNEELDSLNAQALELQIRIAQNGATLMS